MEEQKNRRMEYGERTRDLRGGGAGCCWGKEVGLRKDNKKKKKKGGRRWSRIKSPFINDAIYFVWRENKIGRGI